MAKRDEQFYYQGFTKPNYTQVPDDVFDVLAPELTEAELRVLLYIIRRTFGFKKDREAISLTQLVDGITTRDGRVLDKGTGMSRRGVMKGCAGLIEKGIITVEKRLSELGDNEINVYSLRFHEHQGVGNNVPYRRERSNLGVGNEVAPQQTVKQQTDIDNSIRNSQSYKKKNEERSGPDQPRRGTGDFEPVASVLSRQQPEPAPVDADQQEIDPGDEETITIFVKDFGRQLKDRASLRSSTSRASRLFVRSGLDISTFCSLMYEARSQALQAPNVRNRFSYWFSCLENLLGFKTDGGTLSTPE